MNNCKKYTDNNMAAYDQKFALKIVDDLKENPETLTKFYNSKRGMYLVGNLGTPRFDQVTNMLKNIDKIMLKRVDLGHNFMTMLHRSSGWLTGDLVAHLDDKDLYDIDIICNSSVDHSLVKMLKENYKVTEVTEEVAGQVSVDIVHKNKNFSLFIISNQIAIENLLDLMPNVCCKSAFNGRYFKCTIEYIISMITGIFYVEKRADDVSHLVERGFCYLCSEEEAEKYRKTGLPVTKFNGY